VLLGPAIKQGILNTVGMIGGYSTGSSFKFYFGKNDFFTGQRIWGGEQTGGFGPFLMNEDGSILANRSVSFSELQINKYGPDSSLIWSSTSLLSNGYRRALFDMLYLGNDTGIVVGVQYNQTNPTGPFFYIAKFSGVGYPFDPLGIKQPHLVKKDAFPFPNPTTGLFRLKKEYQKGEIHFFALSGKLMKSEMLVTKGMIDISGFPAGTYFYRAILDGRPHTGKIVKE